jgi:imidazolonepropionase-like amidohydrolase
MPGILDNPNGQRSRRRSVVPVVAAPLLAALVVLTTAGSCLGSSETGAASARASRTPLAIVNGRLIDGSGAKPVKNAVVLIRGERIVFAGPRRKVAIPRNARRLDAHGKTILPGFINTHAHQVVDESNLRAWLLGGVTTVRDLGSGPDYDWVFAERDRLNRSARTARLLTVGPLITVPGGYPGAIWGNPGLEVTSVDDAREQVDRLIHAGCDTVKIALESGQIFGRDPLPMLSPAEVKAIVEVAHAHGKRVSAHAMVTKDIERAVDEIAHFDVENIPQSLIERMVANHVDWVPTIELLRLVRATIYGDSLKRFARAGGIVALGTDYMGAGPGYDYDLGMPVHELVYMDQLGLTPMQAITAATANAAYALNRPELGMLKAGKIADVIVVEGNPLANLEVLHNVKLVVHNGVVVRSKLK